MFACFFLPFVLGVGLRMVELPLALGGHRGMHVTCLKVALALIERQSKSRPTFEYILSILEAIDLHSLVNPDLLCMRVNTSRIPK